MNRLKQVHLWWKLKEQRETNRSDILGLYMCSLILNAAVITLPMISEMYPSVSYRRYMLSQSLYFYMLSFKYNFFNRYGFKKWGYSLYIWRLYLAKISHADLSYKEKLLRTSYLWHLYGHILPRESCGQRSLVGCCPWGHRVGHDWSNSSSSSSWLGISLCILHVEGEKNTNNILKSTIMIVSNFIEV